MAFGHGIDADFDFSGSSIKAYIESIDPTFDREIADIRTLGQAWVQRLAGHKVASVSVSGAYDATLDNTVWTAWDGDVAVAWVYYPQGNSSGKVKFSGNCRVTSFKPGAAGADAVRYSFDIVSDGAIARGTVT